MGEFPLVSVMMPVYNSEDFLQESIDSILNQTYENFEFIIVDDHSTDSSWEIIKNYEEKENKIKAIRNKKNLNIPKTRNKALKLANGKYYAVQDSDDVSHSDRLRKQVKFLEDKEEYGIVGCHLEVINSLSKKIGFRGYPTSYEEIKKVITRYNPIPQPGVMMRAEIIENDIGYYNEKYTRCQDYDLWLRIAENYKISNLDEALVQYRRSETQGLVKNFNKSLKYTLEIQRKWLYHNKFFSPVNVVSWYFKNLIKYMPKKVKLMMIDRLFYS